VMMYLQRQEAGPSRNDAARAAVQTDVDALAAAIDSNIKAAQLRADGIAQTPMLRAAVETDAATVKDMVGSDFLFTPIKGEVFELFQLRDATHTTLLRIPASAPAITPPGKLDPKVESDGTNLAVTVSTPISTQGGKRGGTVALQARIDLTAIKRSLETHAVAATLTGFGKPLVLIAATATATAPDPASMVRLPVAPRSLTSSGAALDLALGTAPTSSRTKTYALVRNASWGVGGLLLLTYLTVLLRGRRRG
jgi:hypothetical protein